MACPRRSPTAFAWWLNLQVLYDRSCTLRWERAIRRPSRTAFAASFLCVARAAPDLGIAPALIFAEAKWTFSHDCRFEAAAGDGFVSRCRVVRTSLGTSSK